MTMMPAQPGSRSGANDWAESISRGAPAATQERSSVEGRGGHHHQLRCAALPRGVDRPAQWPQSGSQRHPPARDRRVMGHRFRAAVACQLAASDSQHRTGAGARFSGDAGRAGPLRLGHRHHLDHRRLRYLADRQRRVGVRGDRPHRRLRPDLRVAHLFAGVRILHPQRVADLPRNLGAVLLRRHPVGGRAGTQHVRRRVLAGAPVRRHRRRAGRLCTFRSRTQGARSAQSRPGAPVSTALAPIGIFDSGVGGLTVARAIIDQLPDEDIIYVGDTANGPYGPLTIPEIRAHALAIGDDLVDRGVKALVIACNSASSACLRDARERYDVPVVEVILPAVRRAVAATRNGRIGVIGTRATIASHSYQDAFAAAPDTEITAVACPRFVDFVERGITSGRQVLGLAEGYLEPLQRAGVDTLVLGCTHYPLLSGIIQLAMGESVTLVSSAEETAKQLVRVLTEQELLRPHDAPPATRVFEATGDPEAFTSLAARFLGPAITTVQPIHRHSPAR